MSVQIYGNAPAGEHYARYVSNFNTKYPKGLRLVIAFGLCTPDGSEAIYGGDDEPLTAVIVCNVPKGDNPKSVAHKVRKAMLTADEYDPFTSAFKVPPWEHFEQPLPDGSHRVLNVQIEQTKANDGAWLSLVSHIRQPRDGAWFTVRQTYDGPPYPWLTMDGQRKKLSEKELAELPRLERDIYDFWTMDCSTTAWARPNGQFVSLSDAELSALDPLNRIHYEVARAKHRSRPPSK